MAAPRKKKDTAEEESSGFSPELKRIFAKHPAIMRIGEVDMRVRKIPTSIYTLDDALGGGLPMGKVIEIHGGSGAGKTSLACLSAAQIQKAYPTKRVCYLDVESALDEVLAIEIYGLDPLRTDLVRPSIDTTAEEIVDILVDCALSDEYCCVVLDSVAGLTTDNEMKNSAGQIIMAPIATLLGRNIKKLSSRPNPESAAVLLMNQQRHALGQGGITTPGGSAVEFYPSLRLRLRKSDPVKNGDEEIGFVCRCQVVKARHSRNRLITSWAVIYGQEGISTLRAIVTVAMSQELIKQNGSWFSITGRDEKWQGMERMLAALRENDELVSFLKDNLVVQSATED